ncbi:hypothetical protein GIB67_035184 [Kingdonia uniflora]|uniref:NAD(+) kinase n=1 Tax=Kingdonia uniflora TaxID=39325 RepID=A0A7J7LDQ4_9MAGN|nr:hypothetical protein GIB67_035184 [Kingdonia uniflora]
MAQSHMVLFRFYVLKASFGEGNSCFTSAQLENSFRDSLSMLDSGKLVHDCLLNTSKGADDHLIEFSEALRTVAKALRQVAEGKASAQAEAAEWRRKYELERERNQHKELSSQGAQYDSKEITAENLSDQTVPQTISIEQLEKCCGKHGICSHEVLRDGETDFESKMNHNKIRKKVSSTQAKPHFIIEDNLRFGEGVNLRKASFRLSWGCNGSGQHKHDIVSFERGNITTAERSSKQISLKWESQPQTVLILTKPNSSPVRSLCAEMIRWLKDYKGIDVFVEPQVRIELLSDSPYFNFVQTWVDGFLDNLVHEAHLNEEIMFMHTKVDLVITLGGDGTVLWAASMFKGPVPPVVPFSLGSLGFMTPFQSEHYRRYLDSILKGPISITLRHRLQCHVIRDAAKDELETEESILVLNEVTVDRGMSSYLTNLECYCDSSFVTCVQGDGLILSTTSGSTAYSLAAGGSMVHPQVPGILFTPICPHSLSFRPLILPEYVTLRVQVPFTSRGHAWASFDGKDRKKLAAGDALVISMAQWPVPTACQVDSTNDFLHSIHEGLHWNLRKTQSFDGPRES